MKHFTPPLEPGQPIPSYEGIYYTLFAVSAALLLLFWVQAWGLHGIGKKEHGKCAWLAWIPGFSGWVLGSLEENRKIRMPLLVLEIVTVLLPILLFWGFFGFCLVINDFVMQDIYENWAIWLVMLVGGGGLMLLMLIPSIVRLVMRGEALRAVFRKYAPEKARLYGILSRFLLPIPILVAICNKRAQ